MQEKYFYIDPEKARALLAQGKKMKPAQLGVDRVSLGAIMGSFTNLNKLATFEASLFNVGYCIIK